MNSEVNKNAVSKVFTNSSPFFVLGCVRSGTTMLRDMLRLHPRLECPEETHFFRWADPFASPRYDRNYITMSLFKKHRNNDGIKHSDFHEARRVAENKREMADAYGSLYLNAQNNLDGRWFDKTPQNIYGIFLIGQMYPDAKFIYIHRNPLNVVASLVEGKVMAKHSVKGAVNYWNEAMILMHEYKKLNVNRVLELSYESVTDKPDNAAKKILSFVGEDSGCYPFSEINTHPEKNKYKTILSQEEIDYVRVMTEPFFSEYHYA